MPPNEPVAVPPGALQALESLRDALQDRLPAEARFGFGVKQTDNRLTETLALVVLLPEKRALEELGPEERIQSTWEGYPTDVVVSRPQPIAGPDSAPYNPLRGGIEIGEVIVLSGGLTAGRGSGTLGCVVQRRSDGRRLLLTANHVATDLNEVHQPKPGSPGAAKIGAVVAHSVVRDCSAIDPTNRGTRDTIEEIGPVMGSAPIRIWDVAKKRSRTTRLTTGVVRLVVPFAGTLAIEAMLISTFPFGGVFAWSGDSGSVVVNAGNEVVGLLHSVDQLTVDAAGNPLTASGWALPIQIALDELRVDVAVTPPLIYLVSPDTAVGALSTFGFVSLFGWGFDPGSVVTFDGVTAPSTTFVSPTQLRVIPPILPLGTSAGIAVANASGDWSTSSPVFTY